ncbi:MAG TPA: DinB family protein [Bryobacteraceae bacterium]|nr:DinB family protein [Bryobacteraceae bacterium]
MIPLRITPVPGYSPTVGRLVSILTYVRQGSLAAVEGLSRDHLDHLYDVQSNTIGALLAHMAAVERWYQVFTFESREPSATEVAAISAGLNLGEEARQAIKGRDLGSYLDELERVREATLAGLSARDDAWLEAPLAVAPDLNAHWAWFHVAEDELGHRGQIRWLRKRLPAQSAGVGRT